MEANHLNKETTQRSLLIEKPMCIECILSIARGFHLETKPQHVYIAAYQVRMIRVIHDAIDPN